METPSNKIMALLISAAADGRDDDIKVWLKNHDAKFINNKDFYGWTALMAAAREGRISTVLILLSYGGDPSIKDDHGKTAAYYARKMHFDVIAETLDKAEAKSTSEEIERKAAEEKEIVKNQIRNLRKNAPNFKLKK